MCVHWSGVTGRAFIGQGGKMSFAKGKGSTGRAWPGTVNWSGAKVGVSCFGRGQIMGFARGKGKASAENSWPGAKVRVRCLVGVV